MSHNPALAELIQHMAQFASTTRDDRLSVEVARVVQRLRNRDKPFERAFSRREQAVIRPFIAHIAALKEREAAVSEKSV
jgi:hypothetical protein